MPLLHSDDFPSAVSRCDWPTEREDIIGLPIGGEMSMRTGNIEYHYNNYGRGLISYTLYDYSPLRTFQY